MKPCPAPKLPDRTSATFFKEQALTAIPNVALDSDALTVNRATSTAQTVSFQYAVGNDQEKGIQEGNLVQTDGEYLYSVSESSESGERAPYQLVVTDVRDTSNLAVVARYELESPIEQLLLSDDRVILLSQSDNSVVVTVLNVANPSSPTFAYESTIQGQLSQSRAIGNHVYVIADAGGQDHVPALETFCYADEQGCFYETMAQYVDRTSELIRDSMSGTVETKDADGNVSSRNASLTHPLVPLLDGHDFSVSTIVSLDVSGGDPGPVDIVSVLHEGNGDVYVSAQSIFLVDRTYQDAEVQGLSYEGDQGEIIWQSSHSIRERATRIEKIGFDESGDLSLAASGMVKGHMLNSFSISEHEGDLRIATERDSGNAIYVLQQDGEELKVTGSVEDLAPGEQIYSARFEGDRGFVVTFRKVDPLFIFDLSDATNPELLGELKVTGYSNYLHVIDENHILGIGREANGGGLFQEMQVSLFDITDPENPTLKHRYGFEGGRNLWSPLMQDAWNLGSHQAINYFASHQTLVMPIYEGNGWNWSWQRSGGQANVSMRVLDIDIDDGITALGTIDFDDAFNPHDARSVRIGDDLLAISPTVVQSHSLRNPDQQLDKLRIGSEVPSNSTVIKHQPDEPTGPLTTGPVTTAGPIDQPILPANEVPANEVPFDAATQPESTEIQNGWHNLTRPMDVDNDGDVKLSDLLRIINFISRHGARATASYADGVRSSEANDAAMVDINNDGNVTPKDVLQMVNHFQRQSDARSLQAASATLSSPESAPLADEESVDQAIEMLTSA